MNQQNPQRDKLASLLDDLAQGEQRSVDELAPDLVAFTTQLEALAESVQPNPEFVTAVERRITTPQRPLPQSPPESYLTKLWRFIIMSKKQYTVGMVAALAALAIILIPVVWFITRDTNENNQNEIATNTTDDDSSTAEGELPLLPALSSGSERGFGGGQVAADALDESATAGEQEEALSDEMMGMPVAPGMLRAHNIFSNTNFILNTTLPTEPSKFPVYELVPTSAHTLEEARQIANSLGFTGPLYTPYWPERDGIVYIEPEVAPSLEGEEGETDSVEAESADADLATEQAMASHEATLSAIASPRQQTYVVFDETKMLTIDPFGISYQDRGVEILYDGTINEQAVQIAEAFLNERSLLTFTYEARRIWGNDVEFARVVNGQTLETAEIWVSVSESGQVASFHTSTYREVNMLGEYPLRTAESAWQLLQSGVIENDIPFTYPPTEEETAIVEDPPFEDEEYRYWQRTYSDGEDVHTYMWLTLYEPAEADSSASPYLETYPLNLNASAEEIGAIAAAYKESPHTPFHFSGIVSSNGTALDLASWELLPDYRPPFIAGVTEREGDNVLIVTQDGEKYILPSPPADLPMGENVYVDAANHRDVGAAYSILDWNGIEFMPEHVRPDVLPDIEPLPLEEPAVSEPLAEPERVEDVEEIDSDDVFIEPAIWYDTVQPYTSVTINEVSLGYFTVHPILSEAQIMELESSWSQPTLIVQPVWQFTGVTDTGELLQFSVPAVDETYITTAP